MSAELSTTPLLVSGASQVRAPRVNLLPPEIAERRSLQRLQAGLAAGVVAAVAVTGGLAYLQHSQAQAAKARAAAQVAVTDQLTTRVNGLASVGVVYSEVDQAKALIQQALGNQVLWSHYLTDMSLITPDNVWLTQLTFTGPTASAAAKTAAAASHTSGQVLPGSTGLGTVTMSGVALSRNDVATWLEALAREKGLAAPYASSIVEKTIGTTVVYDWSITVVLTSQALSGRASTLLGSTA
jgi:Tfp pilus assembly protein PilN